MKKTLEERIEKLEKQVQQLAGSTGKRIRKALGIGDTFELIGLEWKILDITDAGYVCLAGRLKERMQFDIDCNDWQSSNLRNYLNTELYKKLADEIGEDNILPFERDLLSLDGQTEYGTCEDKVSLISVDEYRKYRALIPNAEDYIWWTVTPDSTRCNNDSRWVRVVSPSGDVLNYCYGSSFGVRPFCIFSSAIFESGE